MRAGRPSEGVRAQDLPRFSCVLTAAGSGTRMGGGLKKEFVPIRDPSGGPDIAPLALCLRAFLQIDPLCSIVITLPSGPIFAECEKAARSAIATICDSFREFEPRFVPGGASRQESVYIGLQALASIAVPKDGAIVLIHDAARPWISPELILSILRGTQEKSACLPVIPTVDTTKEVGEDGLILRHLDRAHVVAVQTPQGFRFSEILKAHSMAAEEAKAAQGSHAEPKPATDDAELYAKYIGPVYAVTGLASNKKITFPEDLSLGGQPEKHSKIRVGQGWDIHRLVPGRRLVLGGVLIPHELGEDAHSDGDALTHAVIDALLGALCLGDIGKHFPPSDPEWKDADSMKLLAIVLELIRYEGATLVNLDCTVILERPRLASFIPSIRAKLAEALSVDEARVSVKAKTNEGLGPIGEGKAVEAEAYCLLELK